MKALGRKAGKEWQAVAAGGARKKKKVTRTGEGDEELPPSAIPWSMDVQDADGEMAVVHFKESQTAPWVTIPVPAEWANEMMRWAAAVLMAIRRVASGHPLKLEYPRAPLDESTPFQDPGRPLGEEALRGR